MFGRGPDDILFVPGFFSNLILNWELPGMARFLERLSSVASFPERAASLSVYGLLPVVSRTEDYPYGPTLEQWD